MFFMCIAYRIFVHGRFSFFSSLVYIMIYLSQDDGLKQQIIADAPCAELAGFTVFVARPQSSDFILHAILYDILYDIL